MKMPFYVSLLGCLKRWQAETAVDLPAVFVCFFSAFDYIIQKTEGGAIMATRGRKNKYDSFVKPRLDEIKRWAAAGATEREICSALGVSVSAFNDYKSKKTELSDALRAGRQNVVLEIKAALYKKAIGFQYEEKVGRKKGDDDVQTEVYKRYCPPDTTAAAMLLRNYSDEWRDKDKQSNEFRRQEIEIKKALAESNNFDVSFDGTN
jgi:hypothetical protein